MIAEKMCCSLKTCLVTVLTVILLLTLARQTFDFIGRLWVPIVVNFVQIIFIIFAFFGTLQYRLAFLTIFCLWTPFFALWNGFLICFYMSVQPLERNARYLSFGLPQRFSHSFWAEHYAFCKASYDNAADAWISDQTACMVHYYHIEVATAALFVVLSLLVFPLALIFLFCSKRKPARRSPNPYLGGSLPRRQPTVTVEFNEGNGGPNTSAVVNRFPTGGGPRYDDRRRSSEENQNDVSMNSGYMNASFDSTSPGQQLPASGPVLDPNGRLVQAQIQQQQNYQRRSTKDRRGSSRSARHKRRLDAGGARNSDDYSQATTAEMALDSPDSAGGGVVGIGGRRRSRSDSRPKTDEYDERRSRTRSQSPINGLHSRMSNMTAESQLTPESPPPDIVISAEQRRQPPSRQTVGYRLSSDHLAHSRQSPVQFYGHDQQVADVRLRSSMDPMMSGFSDVRMREQKTRRSKNQPTSLVSFDPKSNTLIRVHEHMDPDSTNDDDGTFDELPPPPLPAPLPPFDHHHNLRSSVSEPRFPGPPPSADRLSHDSGMPGSISEASTSRYHHQPSLPTLADYNQPRYEPSYLRQTQYSTTPEEEQNGGYLPPRYLNRAGHSMSTDSATNHDGAREKSNQRARPAPIFSEQALLV